MMYVEGYHEKCGGGGVLWRAIKSNVEGYHGVTFQGAE